MAKPKRDAVATAAVELAAAAAHDYAGRFGVGDHIGSQVDGERQITHFFACPHPAYEGWRWAVSLVRASRARAATVNEVSLLPGPDAPLPPEWKPWAERIQAGDVTSGMTLPTPENDPRLEPGFAGEPEDGEAHVISELGLGRSRVLSAVGRDAAADRWFASAAGPNNQISEAAPGQCGDCGYFVRVMGGLGAAFGVCANAFSARDAAVVHVGHGCGAHSDVLEDERGIELPEPVFDTLLNDETLFD